MELNELIELARRSGAKLVLKGDTYEKDEEDYAEAEGEDEDGYDRIQER